MLYYDVLIEHSALSLNQTFSYSSEKDIPIGVRVKVPFGRQTLVGMVMNKSSEKPQGDFKIRSILSVIDQVPILSEELQGLSLYLSNSTLSSLMSVIKTMLPSSYKPASNAAKVVMEDWMIPVVDEQEAAVCAQSDKEPAVMEHAGSMGPSDPSRSDKIQSKENQPENAEHETIESENLQADSSENEPLPDQQASDLNKNSENSPVKADDFALTDKNNGHNIQKFTENPSFTSEEASESSRHPEKPVKLTKKQQEVLDAFTVPMPAAQARKIWSPAILKALISKGKIRLEKREKSYVLTSMKAKDLWPELTYGQEQALEKIRSGTNPMILLHGVTGSGKTEVFFHLIQEQLEKGKQVLLLVPEIGLTPMMVSRIQNRFGCELNIYHSRLSSAEAADQYRKVKDMKSGIVLGTRSAVFLPMDNLGLIIMDEEHDTSYKQDKMPKYHARDAAAYRARYHGCKLIMASATPCLESYARAIQNVYQLVVMPDRAAGTLPDIHLIDMKAQRSFGGLSYPLIQQIQNRLERNEQVILLLNRRGYIPTARCTSCKSTIDCEDCGIPLSYHKHEHALVCHICGRRYPLQKECPNCHKASWSDLGLGTQKLEEALQDLFPQARVVRMDADSTRSKYGHAEVLEQFEKNGDILLGTQMVAKGLDFERVTLTGIVNADNALARADYRAAEMSYQMLEQASGRAGRGRYKGQVLIQTYNPDHYVLQHILHHDYKGFFVREMQYRHMGWYPPYLYMGTLVFHHEDPVKAFQAATQARLFLESNGAFVLGPMEITMRKKISRVRLLIKEKDHTRLERLLWDYNEWHKTAQKKIEVEINIDPMILEE